MSNLLHMYDIIEYRYVYLLHKHDIIEYVNLLHNHDITAQPRNYCMSIALFICMICRVLWPVVYKHD